MFVAVSSIVSPSKGSKPIEGCGKVEADSSYLRPMADVYDRATRSYIRDKRSPVPKSASVSKVMSTNKRYDASPDGIIYLIMSFM